MPGAKLGGRRREMAGGDTMNRRRGSRGETPMVTEKKGEKKQGKEMGRDKVPA